MNNTPHELQEHLQNLRQDLLDAVIKHHCGQLLAPPSFPPPTDLPKLAASHLNLLSHLLANTMERLIEMDARLFPWQRSPTLELDAKLHRMMGWFTVIDYRPYPSLLSLYEKEIKHRLEMVIDGKARCVEYRRCWQVLRLLVRFVRSAGVGLPILGTARGQFGSGFCDYMHASAGRRPPRGFVALELYDGWGEMQCYAQLQELWAN